MPASRTRRATGSAAKRRRRAAGVVRRRASSRSSPSAAIMQSCVCLSPRSRPTVTLPSPPGVIASFMVGLPLDSESPSRGLGTLRYPVEAGLLIPSAQSLRFVDYRADQPRNAGRSAAPRLVGPPASMLSRVQVSYFEVSTGLRRQESRAPQARSALSPPHRAVHPPSMVSSAPVTHLDSSDARYRSA